MELQEADPGSQEHSDGFGEQGELRVPRVQQQSPVLGWDEAVMGEWHAELGSRVQSQQFSTVIPDVLVAPEVWDFPFFGLCRAATDPSQCLRVVRGCSWDPWGGWCGLWDAAASITHLMGRGFPPISSLSWWECCWKAAPALQHHLLLLLSGSQGWGWVAALGKGYQDDHHCSELLR